MSAAAVLARLRREGIAATCEGDRIRLRGAGARDHADAVRAHRDEILVLLDADTFELMAEPQPRSARWWRARFALDVAEQQHVFGYPAEDARRRGFFDVLVDYTDADAELRLLPTSAAEPLARAALARLGVDAPEPP